MAWDPPIEEWARLALRYARRHGEIVAVVSAKGLLLSLPALCRTSSHSLGVAVPVAATDSAAIIAESLADAHARLAEHAAQHPPRARSAG